MAATRRSSSESSRPRRPATTPEARENQMIALAVDLAEKQLADGTASAQVITHYLKLGSVRESLEREKLRKGIQLDDAKIESMSSAKGSEDLYKKALNAFRGYAGQEVEPEDEN